MEKIVQQKVRIVTDSVILLDSDKVSVKIVKNRVVMHS